MISVCSIFVLLFLGKDFLISVQYVVWPLEFGRSLKISLMYCGEMVTWFCIVEIGIFMLLMVSACLFISSSSGEIVRDAYLWMSIKVLANASAFSASE